MKTIDEKTTKALRSLVIINNDRYEGYKDAAEHAKDADLKALFTKFSQQSKRFSDELEAHITDSDETPREDETKVSGKLYRGWMELRDHLTSNNRKAVLSSCEFGEDAAKKEYNSVLEDAEDVSTEALAIIRRQFNELKDAHDTVKAMRDSA